METEEGGEDKDDGVKMFCSLLDRGDTASSAIFPIMFFITFHLSFFSYSCWIVDVSAGISTVKSISGAT